MTDHVHDEDSFAWDFSRSERVAAREVEAFARRLGVSVERRRLDESVADEGGGVTLAFRGPRSAVAQVRARVLPPE